MMYRGKENQPGKASLPEYTEGNLEDYMEILYNHQKQSEKTGKYMEAEMAKKKLSQMKVQLQKQRKSDIFERHQKEKSEFQTAHFEQMTEFNKYWDERMIEYQKEAQRLEQETIDRHNAEMSQFEQRIQESIAFKPKQSSEILNLKKIEESLAKQQNYMEALHVQKQIQELERAEQQRWNYTHNNKIKNLITQLNAKQENEVNALRQRIQQGFEEQKKIRNTQQEKLIQKYKNFIKELEYHHNQELSKFEKSSKLQSTMNFSRRSNMSSRVSQASQRF